MVIINYAMFAPFLIILEIVVSICMFVWCLCSFLNRKVDTKSGMAYASLSLWNCMRIGGLVIYTLRYWVFEIVYITWMISLPERDWPGRDADEVKNIAVFWVLIQPLFMVWNVYLYLLSYTAGQTVYFYRKKKNVIDE